MLLELVVSLAACSIVGLAGLAAMTRLASAAKAMIREAYASGYRAALREATRVADLRADIAVELAPVGRLGSGMVRAQAVHEVALELRQMLEAAR